jgi:hypothetical protein
MFGINGCAPVVQTHDGAQNAGLDDRRVVFTRIKKLDQEGVMAQI